MTFSKMSSALTDFAPGPDVSTRERCMRGGIVTGRVLAARVFDEAFVNDSCFEK